MPTAFALATCAASAFLNIRALVAFHRLGRMSRKDHSEDYRLLSRRNLVASHRNFALVFALLGFAGQLCMAAFWALTFSLGTSAEARRILVDLLPFIVDLLSLSGSPCLLITRLDC